jgi:hypothetical protein
LNFALERTLIQDVLYKRIPDEQTNVATNDVLHVLLHWDDRAFVDEIFFRFRSKKFHPACELGQFILRPDAEGPAAKAFALSHMEEHYEESVFT